MNRFNQLLFVLGLSVLLATAVVRAAGHPAALVGSIHPATPVLEARSRQSATLLPDGRVLIAGGMRRNQDFYKSAELYDPATSQFQPTSEMNTARVGQVAVLLRTGKVLIAGGWVGRGASDTAELYDPGRGKFTAVGKMTALRGNPSATLLANGDVLIAGGADHDTPGGIATAELFQVASASFQSTGSMHHGQSRKRRRCLATDGF